MNGSKGPGLFDDDFGETLGQIFLVALVAAVVVVGLYVWQFHGGLSPKHERWNEFGGFFGGTVGPLFGFFTLIALLASLRIQRTTLTETKRQGVLQELQRLLAVIAKDIDDALRVKMDRADGLLWGVVTSDHVSRITHETKREVSVLEGLRSVLKSMLRDRLSHNQYIYVAQSTEAEDVFRALTRLDDCLVEFVARGGDSVIGALYGRAYGEPARVLAALQAVKVGLDLDAAYGIDALDRLGLPKGDEQVALVRRNFQVLADQMAAKHQQFEDQLRRSLGI